MSESTDRVRAFFDRLARDPLHLAATLAVLVVIVGFAGVLRPLQGRIESSRGVLTDASGLADTVRDIAMLVRQEEHYRERLQVGSELVDWQDYVLQAIADAGCELVVMESGNVKRVQGFKIVELPLVVRGSYVGVREFIDRLERGHRLVRFDRLSLESADGVVLRCTLRGLTAAGPGSADESEGDDD